MDITVEELKTRRDKGEQIHLIDVREPHEYEEFNLGGQLMPLGTIPSGLAELEHLKNEEVVVHCKAGSRSAAAVDFLKKNGFTNVRNLLGGVMQWQASFPG